MADILPATNPVGSSNSFTGTATGLEIVGDFAYAYSGGVPADNNSHTVFSFRTGNYILKCTFVVNGALNPLTSSVAGTNGEIKLGGATVGAGPCATALDNNYFYKEDLIIPAYTQVDGLINFHETDSNDIATALITGSIYR